MNPELMSAGLRVLLADLRPQRTEPVLAYVPALDRWPAGVEPFAQIREREGACAVVALADAERYGWPVAFAAVRIELGVNSDLDAVGLTAAVAARLAREEIPCNVIAGLRHDHLLVPLALAEDAMAALSALHQEANNAHGRP